MLILAVLVGIVLAVLRWWRMRTLPEDVRTDLRWRRRQRWQRAVQPRLWMSWARRHPRRAAVGATLVAVLGVLIATGEEPPDRRRRQLPSFEELCSAESTDTTHRAPTTTAPPGVIVVPVPTTAPHIGLDICR